jgi:RNA polymerase sigma-70 factor (ECF subfamily)
MIDTPEEQAKFEVLYEKYYKLLIGVALHILHDGADAEDAVQQSFLKLIPNLKKIKDVSSRQTVNYLVIMVRRVCFDLYNARKKIDQVPFEDLSAEPGAEADNLLGQMEYSELLRCVKALPDIYGDALYLMYYEDFTPKELAATLGISVKAVQKRIERARRLLKAALLEGSAYEN